MRLQLKYLLLWSGLATAGLTGCNKWDDHIALHEQALNRNLMEEVSLHPELSKFSEYLSKTGLDKEIISSKTYSVWAPSNDALQALSADVINDTEKLKALLLNHISAQLTFVKPTSDTVRVPMLNGKRISFSNKKFDAASVVTADRYVKNGVLHIIDKVVLPLQNIWEFVESTKQTYDQNAYLTSCVYSVQDPAIAELDGIDPATGKPVYKPGTGMVEINSYTTKVYDIGNEDSLYTYIVLTNAAFSAEVDAQKPYFKSEGNDTTLSNASWNIVKDFTIKGVYEKDKLPPTLLSKFNVHVSMNNAAIVETHRVSNGIVYVMNAAACPIEEKIPSFVIEGEFPSYMSSSEAKYLDKVFTRERFNPLTNQSFKDIYVNLGTGLNSFFMDYRTNNLFTTTYKVYWVALNDKTISGVADDPYGTDSVMRQSLLIGSRDKNVYFDLTTVATQSPIQPDDYREVFVGEFTNTGYGWLLNYPATTPDGTNYTSNNATRSVLVQAQTVPRSGIPNNITLDYLRFVPVH